MPWGSLVDGVAWLGQAAYGGFPFSSWDRKRIGVAANRYYAERSRDSASARTRHTLRLLTALRNAAGDVIWASGQPYPPI